MLLRSAIAIAHMRAHRARENSTRLGRVALTGGPVCSPRGSVLPRRQGSSPHSRQAGVTRRQFNSGCPGSLYSIH